MRVAIYARVSTQDQHAANQIDELREWCRVSGHAVATEYMEAESGGRGAEKRQRLSAMLTDAHKRRFDMVVVWAIDRLSREGMVKTVSYLQTLADCNVCFHSYTEPALSSDNPMVRDILLAVMSSLARAERVKISERTKAGLERVRRDGSRSGLAIGRPALDEKLRERIKRIRLDNPTMAAHSIARLVKLDPKTVRKYL